MTPFTQRGSSCSAADNFDFRVAVGAVDGCPTNPSTCGTNPAQSPPCSDPQKGCTGYMSHFFCGKVDKFSSFTLTNSNTYLNKVVDETAELAIFQAGKLTSGEGTTMPEEGMNTRVQVLDRNTTKCPMGLIVTFLVYNVTLDSGDYKYKNRDPIGNGFVSTCNSDDECEFASGEDVYCLKDPHTGTSNCGRCATGEGQAAEDIRVLVSYYGTSSDGKALLSGSSNPLNFRQFALGGMAGDLFDVCSRLPSVSVNTLKAKMVWHIPKIKCNFCTSFVIIL